jgi:hypothetical protein
VGIGWVKIIKIIALQTTGQQACVELISNGLKMEMFGCEKIITRRAKKD